VTGSAPPGGLEEYNPFTDARTVSLTKASPLMCVWVCACMCLCASESLTSFYPPTLFLSSSTSQSPRISLTTCHRDLFAVLIQGAMFLIAQILIRWFSAGFQAPPGDAPKAAPSPSQQNTQPAIMKPTEEPPAYSQQQTQVLHTEHTFVFNTLTQMSFYIAHTQILFVFWFTFPLVLYTAHLFSDGPTAA